MPVEWLKLTSLELQALPKKQTVFFFPVGPLEDHGPHLPMGLDLMEAAYQSEALASFIEEKQPGWVGVLMPSAPLGLESNTTKVSITVRPHVLRDWLVDSCKSLIRMGYFHFVCISGHLGPRQLTAIEEAGKWIYRKRFGHLFPFLRRERIIPTLLSASSAGISPQMVIASPFWPDPIEHGGRRDTSVALVVCPEQVKPYGELPKIKRGHSRWKRNFLRRKRAMSLYWGEPHSASIEIGLDILSQWKEKLFCLLMPVWTGKHPGSTFRSWYSILFPNKSLFKAWSVITVIFLVMVGWCFFFAMMLSL